MLLNRLAVSLGTSLVLSLSVLAASAAAAGHITYSVGEELLRVEAGANAQPENITAGLDRNFPGGGDQFLNQSPDGKSLIIQSFRFGCDSTPCLAVISSDLERGEAVANGTLTTEGFSAVGNGGRVVVYPAQSSDGRVDLFVVRKTGNKWSKPKNVTTKSPGEFNVHPAIATNSKKVLHNCGTAPDPSAGTLSICESNLRSGKTKVKVAPSDGPKPPEDPVFGEGSLHHADYLGRGKGLVFESQWCCEGESIWWLPKGKPKPKHVKGASPNNVAPCGLPDGRVVSLDLGRPEGGGVHELMITSPTSKKRIYPIEAGIDVNDIGIGCGK